MTIDTTEPAESGATGRRPLPATPDDITSEWLTAALANGGVDGVVATFRSEPIGEGSGMLSALVRVDLDYATGTGPEAVVVKLPIANDNLAVAVGFHCYEREVHFYVNAADRTPARTPRIYLADIESEQEFAVVMEDLSGYRQGDQVVGCTAAEAEACMDELSKLHAAFWDRVDGGDLEFIPYHFPSYFSDGLEQGAIAYWDAMIDLYGDHVPDFLRDVRQRYLAAIPSMQEWMTAAPRTIVHGDWRMDNLFFGSSPGHAPVAVCDWQGIMRGKAMHDVAYFLSQSMPSDQRREHERDLVASWHAGLAEAGVADYGAEQAWEDYRRAVLYMWTYVTVIAGSLDPSNERGVAWMSEMVSRAATAFDDLGVLPLLVEFE
jgi:aminoglycoside/choline kinase family phosphotransferase